MRPTDAGSIDAARSIARVDLRAYTAPVVQQPRIWLDTVGVSDITEPEAGRTRPITFIVRCDRAPTVGISGTFRTNDISTISRGTNRDYVPISRQIWTIAVGRTSSALIPVQVRGDRLDEGTEQFPGNDRDLVWRSIEVDRRRFSNGNY